MSFTVSRDAPAELDFNPEAPHAATTGKIFKDVASFTATLGSFEATPFLLGGIILSLGRGQNDIAQVVRGMGGVMVVASPLIAIAKIVALPVLAGSAVATAVTGAVHGVDLLIDKIKEPTLAKRQRIEHTQHFVQRMRDNLQALTEEEKMAVEKIPGTLIATSLLSVAFLSRKLEGKQLKDGSSIIQSSEVESMDSHAQEFFARVCKLKEALRELNLSPEDNHAWEYLSKGIHDFHFDKSKLSAFEQETLKKLIEECDDLSKTIAEDEIFLTEWKKKT